MVSLEMSVLSAGCRVREEHPCANDLPAMFLVENASGLSRADRIGTTLRTLFRTDPHSFAGSGEAYRSGGANNYPEPKLLSRAFYGWLRALREDDRKGFDERTLLDTHMLQGALPFPGIDHPQHLGILPLQMRWHIFDMDPLRGLSVVTVPQSYEAALDWEPFGKLSGTHAGIYALRPLDRGPLLETYRRETGKVFVPLCEGGPK